MRDTCDTVNEVRQSNLPFLLFRNRNGNGSKFKRQWNGFFPVEMVTVVIRLIPFSMDLFIGMEMGKDSKPFGTAFSVSRLRLVAMGRLGSWNGNGKGNGKGNGSDFKRDGFYLRGMANPRILKSEIPNENYPHP